MATTVEITTRITELETAIHSLATGARVVRITAPDGTSTQYQESDLDKLRELLKLYQSDLVAASNAVRGPIYFTPLT